MRTGLPLDGSQREPCWSLFAGLARKVVKEDVSALIEKGVAKLRKATELNMNTLRSVKAAVWAEVERLDGIQTVPARRTCSIKYREWKIELNVKCLMEQIDMALHSACRGWAVAQSRMSALPGEASLCLLAEQLPHSDVDMDIIGKAVEARKYIQRVVDAEGDSVSAERIKDGLIILRKTEHLKERKLIHELISSHTTKLLGQDDHYVIDAEFI
eukprot:988777-Amphidinium_carterae.1